MERRRREREDRMEEVEIAGEERMGGGRGEGERAGEIIMLTRKGRQGHKDKSQPTLIMQPCHANGILSCSAILKLFTEVPVL